MNRRGLLLVPLAAAVAVGGGFFAMLRGLSRHTFDPREVPSPLVGKPVPPFKLDGLTDADLRGSTRPLLVNFFASWCAPCVEEAPVLMSLREAGTEIVGVAYKDKPADTDAFLARHGNPFARRTADQPGVVSIDWGVSGVPETFLVSKGVVRWHFAGALTPEVVDGGLLPAMQAAA